MAEWSKAADSKSATSNFGVEGSNPSHSVKGGMRTIQPQGGDGESLSLRKAR